MLRKLSLNLKLHMVLFQDKMYLMQQFYEVHMERNEKVQSHATRMEGSVNHI